MNDKYIININGYDVETICGTEAAYTKAEEMCELMGGFPTACLLDGNTGEVLADSDGYRA